MQYAYVWRSGRIEFGDVVPAGALLIGHGGKAFRTRVEVYARHSRSGNGWLLVPGIPEAATDDDALLALRLFAKMVLGRRSLSRREIQAFRAAQKRSLDAMRSRHAIAKAEGRA